MCTNVAYLLVDGTRRNGAGVFLPDASVHLKDRGRPCRRSQLLLLCTIDSALLCLVQRSLCVSLSLVPLNTHRDSTALQHSIRDGELWYIVEK